MGTPCPLRRWLLCSWLGLVVRAFHFPVHPVSLNYKEIAWRLVEKHPEVQVFGNDRR